MTTYSHTFAGTIASELIEILSPSCGHLPDGSTAIQIVGSLRRLKPKVNDIDIIAMPRFEEVKDDALFGEPVRENLLDIKLAELCMDGTLLLESNGDKIKRFLKCRKPQGPARADDNSCVPIDLYIASPSTWWTLMLIRTGSREHNIRLAMRAQELHMQLKADGSGLMSPGGSTIPIEGEEDIFKHLKMPFKKPKERE